MGMELSKVGLWSPTFLWGGPERRDVAAELDELGYGALWIGAASGDLELVEDILDATPRLIVATGIVNIWLSDAAELATAYHRVAGRFADRFILGVGMGHAPAAEALGRRYERPLEMLTTYLDGLDAGGVPVDRRVLAALRPRALELAASRAAGAHPYLVNPEHTAAAREVLGEGVLLAPEQKVIMAGDRADAHALARAHLEYYLTLPNYRRSFVALGFTDDDMVGGGSDRLVDAMYAWGGVDAAAKRVAEHLDAGADHVAVQVVGGTADVVTRTGTPQIDDWRRLAPVLLS